MIREFCFKHRNNKLYHLRVLRVLRSSRKKKRNIQIESPSEIMDRLAMNTRLMMIILLGCVNKIQNIQQCHAIITVSANVINQEEIPFWHHLAAEFRNQFDTSVIFL